MAVHSIDNKRPSADLLQRPLGSGTVGGEHAVNKGFSSRAVNSVVDDTDTRIIYGSIIPGANATFSIDQGDLTTQSNTMTILGGRTGVGTQYSAAQLRFTGTAIGVLGGINQYSGVISFLIDGVATAGRLPTYTTFYIGPGSGAAVNTPILSATATTIVAYAVTSGFPSSGTLMIGSELITYSGKTVDGSGNDNFTGCTRGTNGTAAVTHFASESIYVWGSSIDLNPLYTTDYATKQLLYYNPFLSPGEHTITVYVTLGASGYSRFYFDGFIIGSLVGARNLATQTGTVTLQTLTDANGHAVLGGLVYNSADRAMIGCIGYTQTNVEAGGTGTMAKLGVTRSSSYIDGESRLFYYLHNGPALTVLTIVLTFGYIGEAL